MKQPYNNRTVWGALSLIRESTAPDRDPTQDGRIEADLPLAAGVRNRSAHRAACEYLKRRGLATRVASGWLELTQAGFSVAQRMHGSS